MPLEWTGVGWALRNPPPYDDLPLDESGLDPSCPRGAHRWAEAGWDAAAADPRHHAAVIRDLFPPDRRPPREALDWFRTGFAAQRAGQPRPGIRG